MPARAAPHIDLCVIWAGESLADLARRRLAAKVKLFVQEFRRKIMWKSVAAVLAVGTIMLTTTQEASAGRRACRRRACYYSYNQAPVMVQTAPVAPAYKAPAPAAVPAPVDLAPAPPVVMAPDAPAPTKRAPAIAQTGGTGTTYRSYSYDSAPATRAPVQAQAPAQFDHSNYGIPAATSVPNIFRGDRKMYGISRMPSYR
jgi:hypothetical protein